MWNITFSKYRNIFINIYHSNCIYTVKNQIYQWTSIFDSTSNIYYQKIYYYAKSI